MQFFLNKMVEVSEEEQGVFIRRGDHNAVVSDLESDIRILKYMLASGEYARRSREFIENRFQMMRESHYHIPMGPDQAGDRFCAICGRYYMHKAHARFLP